MKRRRKVVMMGIVEEVLTFEPPGPGVWQRDDVHWPRPVPCAYAELYSEAAAAGFRRFSARYGLLIDHFEQRFPHGFAYGKFHIVGEPKNAKGGPPPAAVLWVLARLHPGLRKRNKAAKRALRERLWLEDLHRWDAEAKPATFAANSALQAVSLRSLDDDALLEHIGRCRDHLIAMIGQHHEFNGPGLLPSALLFAEVMDAIGEPGAAAALLTGASPISSGRSEELRLLADAIRRTPAAAEAVDDPDPAHAIQRLREILPEAFEPYFETTGARLVGDSIDIGSPTFLERPGLMVQAIRAAVEERPSDGDADQRWIASLIASVRERIAPQRRHDFDQLLLEARSCAKVRDERSVYGDVWASGIYRLALLEAGRRAATAGRLEAEEHILDARPDEVRAIALGDAHAPSAREIADRNAFRHRHATTIAPRLLGGEPTPPPSMRVFPRPLRRVNAAAMAQVESMLSDGAAGNDETLVRGIPASRGVREGIARVISGPDEFDRIRSGDVLITRTTSEAFNVVLPLLGAMVCDRGGPLSHAAIVSRECGIPCVVGAGDATALIPDGARVQVDGEAGEVKVLR